MNLLDAWLANFDSEIPGTRQLLARVPEDRADWKPHERSRALGPLALHVASLPRLARIAATEQDFEFATSTALHTPPFTSTRALVAIFDEAAGQARDAVSRLSSHDLAAPWRMRAGGRVVFEEPRIVALWRLTTSHLVHHRGQLTVYLRELNVPLPPLYAPTADEELAA